MGSRGTSNTGYEPLPVHSAGSGEATPLVSHENQDIDHTIEHALHRLHGSTERHGPVFKRPRRDSIESEEGVEVDEAQVVLEGEDRATVFVWILVSAAAISGLLFGDFSTTRTAMQSCLNLGVGKETDRRVRYRGDIWDAGRHGDGPGLGSDRLGEGGHSGELVADQ